MASRTPAVIRRSALTLVLLCATTLVVEVTVPAGARAATRPPLGTAATYAVLAGSAVTNTGATAIIGNVGVSPGTTVTGFPPGSVTGGAIHQGDASALQAKTDLSAAYTNAAAQPVDAVMSDDDLGNRTLTPGVYASPTGFFTLTTSLTLDGQGDPNAVFVLKTGSSLTTSTGSSVTLTGDAQPCNVFWQIGSSATLGIGSGMIGNVLADTSITALSGATVEGRMLAINGAATMDTNTIDSVCDRVLSVSAPVSADFGNGVPGSARSGSLGPVTVYDTGDVTNTNWTTSVTSTDFATGSPVRTIFSDNVRYWSGPVTSTTGNGTFTSGQPTSTDAETISVPATTAFTLTNGVGATSVTWNPVVIIEIPLDAVAGQYSGTVTFSVA